MDFNNLAGSALASYGVGAVVYSQVVAFDPSPRWWLQAGVALLGGFSILVFNNYSKLKWPTFSVKPPVETKIFTPEQYEQKDFECLVHLRNRVVQANSTEGIETIEKLNSIIFSIHTKRTP